MNILKIALLALVLAAPASAQNYTTNYYQIKYSTPTGIATQTMSGYFRIAASSKTSTTYKISLDGVLGQGVFTGVGNSTFSVQTSSGINVSLGGVYAAFMKATTGFFGNLWGNVVGNLTGNVVGNVTGNLTGNADTATTATNIAGGGVGQIPYQSASGATVFLPAPGDGGIVVGNGTSAIPSTSTLVGTASQVVVTKTGAPAALTLSLANPINVGTSGNAGTSTALAANPTNCSAGNYPLGIDASGNVESCTAASGAPKFVQFISSVTTGFFTGTGTIPNDNTKPQQSEGFKVITATITPTNSANTIMIRALVCAAETGNSGDNIAMCVYKDTGADPLGCSAGPSGSDITPCRMWSLAVPDPAGSTSARVYSVRIGCNVGTLDINGSSGSSIYGGALTSSLMLEEWAP